MNDPLPANLAFRRLVQIGACYPALRWLKNQSDLRLAWDTCHNGHWMYWLLTRLFVDRPTRDLAFEASWAAMQRYRIDLRNRPGDDAEYALRADAIRSIVSFETLWEAYQRTFA
jgi:hypothetical protein